MKKTLLLIALVLCCATTIFAQNNKISYQAVVRDTENKLVANKTVEVTVNIYNGPETATSDAVYTETQTVTTNLNGLISLMIGPDVATPAWNSIQWNQARIETTVTLDNTSLGTLKMPLTAVPYALYAKEISPDAVVITNIYNKMQQDSTALADKMHADSLLLHGALNDSTANVRRALKDSVTNVNTRMQTMAENLHNEISTLDNRVTNRMNTISDSVKTTLDSVTAVSTDMQTNYAKLAGGNEFFGNNTFTGTVTAGTVTAGTVTAGTVNASSVTVTCGENVTADVCELLQRINTLEQKINDPQTLLNLVGQMDDEQKKQLKKALGIYVADSVTLNKATTTVTIGGSEVLVAKVWPSNVAQDVQWSSSNPQIATVENGVVYAVAAGQTVITAKSMSEPSNEATCTVTVVPQASAPNGYYNLKRNDDGTWEVTMPTNDLEVEIEVYNE